MKLITNWRQTWRFFSVWAMGAAGSVQTAWLAIPEEMKARIPDDWVNVITLALLVLGVAGRMVRQDDKQG